MSDAVKHEGFAVVDILQPCQTWNRMLTWKFYNEHTYSLQETGHDVTDKLAALEKAFSNGKKIPIGLFYKVKAPVLAENLTLPKDGRLRDHRTSMKELQAIIDELVL